MSAALQKIKRKWVTSSEEKRLKALAAKLIELEGKKEQILVEARKIIGFANPECLTSVSEELEPAFALGCNDADVLLVHAVINRRAWEVQKKIEELNILSREMGFDPAEVNWADSDWRPDWQEI